MVSISCFIESDEQADYASHIDVAVQATSDHSAYQGRQHARKPEALEKNNDAYRLGA